MPSLSLTLNVEPLQGVGSRLYPPACIAPRAGSGAGGLNRERIRSFIKPLTAKVKGFGEKFKHRNYYRHYKTIYNNVLVNPICDQQQQQHIGTCLPKHFLKSFILPINKSIQNAGSSHWWNRQQVCHGHHEIDSHYDLQHLGLNRKLLDN